MLSTGPSLVLLSLAILAAVVAWWFALQARDAAIGVRLTRMKVEQLEGDLASVSTQLQKLRGKFYATKAKEPELAIVETPQQTRDRLAATHPGVRAQLANPATHL